jgi:hypothetical protein
VHRLLRLVGAFRRVAAAKEEGLWRGRVAATKVAMTTAARED